MTADKTDLAGRAVACKGWRWMPGMVDLDGVRLGLRDMSALPDLDDHATIGCLIALVREAWGDRWWVEAASGRLGVWATIGVMGDEGLADQYWAGGSLAEALVAALEAAPASEVQP